MSSAEGGLITDVDAGLVSDLGVEPSYVSEIARKLRRGGYPLAYSKREVDELDILERTWDDMDENAAVRRVSKIIYALEEANPNRYMTEEVGYDAGQSDELGQSQSGASAHLSFSEVGYTEETEWRPYLLFHNESTEYDDIGSLWEESGRAGFSKRLRMDVDQSITVSDKRNMIKELSRSGNDMSKFAERVMQDVFERQFSRYGTQNTPVEVTYGEYNDPMEDFYFEDVSDGYAIQVEVSTRFENPIGEPYIDSKLDRADELEVDRGVAVDMMVMAPAFAAKMLEKYGEDDRVILSEVPNNDFPTGTRFPFEEDDRSDVTSEGSPIIIPDGERTREELKSKGHVGDSYPIVDSDYGGYESNLESVGRQFDILTESRYRNMIRETSEPLFGRFDAPYRIEQYLIDMYWDEGMTQADIGGITGVSDVTISNWMNRQHWNIATRGTETILSDSTKEIWEDMYEGNDPFPRQMTGYEIKGLYNAHPLFDMSDWEEWFSIDPVEREEYIVEQYPADRDITYTIMLGKEERLMPSYSFIIETLRRMDVDIREGVFSSGNVIATGLAREYMINVEQIKGEDDEEVLYVRSDLENDFAEWLSDNEVYFGYEPFNIPGVFVDNDEWDSALSRVERMDDDVVDMWTSIYTKHNLQEERDVTPREGIDLFSRTEIVPDFSLYTGGEPVEIGEFDHLVEVAGPYGAGIIPSEADWEDWYRVNGVAYKELMYKLLGLWDDVLFVVPNSDGVSDELRDDDNYVVVNSTQTDSGFSKFGRFIGGVNNE